MPLCSFIIQLKTKQKRNTRKHTAKLCSHGVAASQINQHCFLPVQKYISSSTDTDLIVTIPDKTYFALI